MVGNDSAETPPDRTDIAASSRPGSIRRQAGFGRRLGAILQTAVGLFRERPLALVPFVVAGLFGAASTLARRASPFPIGVAPFPDSGLLQLRTPVVPALEPAVDIGPPLFLGLKPRFLAALVGWQVGVSAAAAVAFAACLWIAADGDGTPTLERVGWLVAYAIAVDVAALAVVYALWRIDNLGVSLLAVLALAPVAIGLFLTPAAIVLGGRRPRAAIRESVGFAAESPLAISVLLFGLGYVGYALTGVAQFAPASPLGVTVGTVVSVTVAGTAHALVVAASYRLRPIRGEK
ncbi:hypothetical protein [Halopiger thermotolerans]